MEEEKLLGSLRDLLRSDDPDVLVGSGPDDCAHVRHGGNILSMSMDAFVEGTHFTADAAPEDVAYKALAASLSDLAASGCEPRWALVSLALRPGLPDDWGQRFASGMALAARECRVSVIGGDLVAAPHDVQISVAVAGQPMFGGPVTRAGAQPGDAIVVSGSLGGSLLGRHLHPQPRIEAMRQIMAFCARHSSRVHAAMDISDGLALDLTRLCRESGTGAVVHAHYIPVSDAAVQRASATHKKPIEHALGDGEDFELLLTLDSEVFTQWLAESGSQVFTRIGTITGQTGVCIECEGQTKSMAAQGWQHIW